MNYDEYLEKLDDINNYANKKKIKLLKAYTDANIQISIGDYISANHITIQVSGFSYRILHGKPYVEYRGLVVCKNLRRKKSLAFASIFDCDIKKVIKQDDKK